MRRKMDRNLVGMALGIAFLVAGCNKPAEAPPTKGGSATKVEPSTATEPAPSNESAKKAAEALLKKLSQGELTAADVTANFKKMIARPQTEDEKKLGYSDNDLKNWLNQWKGAAFVWSDEVAKVGNATVFRGRVEKPGFKASFAVRVTNEGNSSKVDWLHTSERICSEPKPQSDPNAAAAYDTARNYMDVLLGGDLRQSIALMTPTWRRSIAKPTPSDESRGFDYDPGFLVQKLRSWRNEAVSYSLPQVTLSNNNESATVTAELEKEGKKTPYTLKLVKDRGLGIWLVDDFAK
jgi:hypothetical protein